MSLVRKKASMRKYEIYGVGNDIIDLGSLGKCPYPPSLLELIGLGAGISKKLSQKGSS